MSVGILCGLAGEAACWAGVDGVVVGVSAADPQQARREAQRLVDAGVSVIVSFGLAGALDPTLKAGDLVFGTRVVSGDVVWDCNAKLVERMASHFTQARQGAVCGADTLIDTVDAKKILRVSSDPCPLIVDMESHVAAETAMQAGIPFLVVRAVCDTADMVLPPAACVPLRCDGGTNMPAVLRSIARQPAQILELIKLGRNAARATGVLRHFAAKAVLS